MKIAITGANSSVGRNLLAHVAAQKGLQAVAGVRSESVFPSLPVAEEIEPRVINYADVGDLVDAFAQADAVVHLAGILIESRHSDYRSANVDATRSVVDAARQAGVRHLVFISVIGADRKSANRYFQSKGEAESLITDSDLSASIIRTPLLLGPGTAGATSILWAASKGKTRLLGGGNYTMHPLDVDDLSRAILGRCGQTNQGTACFELVGPEAIPYRDLIKRVATLQGRELTIGNVPIWIAKLGAAVTSRLRGGGMTPTVIDVITLNEVIHHNSADELGISLTPMQETLEKILKNKDQ